MVDTASINYGLTKLTGAFNQIAPHIQNVSEKYVKYCIIREFAQLGVAVIILILSIIAMKILARVNSKTDDLDDKKIAVVIAMVMSGAGIVIGIIGVLAQVYCCSLAMACPEIYAINRFIVTIK